MRATLVELAKIRAHGLLVERYGDGWTLKHEATGGYLMIGDHGQVAPTQWEAAAEALRRIDHGDY